MADSRYFLFYGGKAELFHRKKEFNEMINVIVEGGVPIGDIWAIKGKRLQIIIKEVIVVDDERGKE